MKLKIGLLLDSEYDSKYIYEFVSWAKKQDDIDVSHLIIQNLTKENEKDNFLSKIRKFIKYRGVNTFISYLFFQLLVFFEFQVLKNNINHSNHFAKFDLQELIMNKILLTPIVSKSGFVYHFNEDDINKVRKEKFDLLIRFGSGILHGKILESSRFGVLSFHHADNTINRGGPPGFWEVFLRQSTTGYTLQILTDELDGGNVISKGRIPTRGYFLLNQATLYEISNIYLMQLIKKIAIERKLPKIEIKQPYYYPLYKLPSTGIIFKYIYKTLSFYVARFLYKSFGYDYVWNIGFAAKSWNEVSFWKSRKISRPSGHFLADPFLVFDNQKIFCFAEDYVYKEKRGQIAVYDLTNKKPQRLGVALNETFHLSFPYIFNYENNYYMCPETSEKNEIRLYRCIEFPLKWELFKIIKSNVSAVDTLIFKKDNLWWMFTNIDTNKSKDHHSELHIFYSASPLSCSWASHPMNPVYVDATCARNGGIIEEDGKYFRVSQQHGFGHYGRNIVLNEIINLTTDYFEEKPICSIYPNFYPKISGIHHFHSKNGLTVFDYASWQRI